MSAPGRRALVDRGHGDLSIRRQCQLLSVTRSGVYRPPRAANDNDLALLRRIDELFTAWPFLGSRRMARMLGADGRAVNRKRVQRLMRKMAPPSMGFLQYSPHWLRWFRFTDCSPTRPQSPNI